MLNVPPEEGNSILRSILALMGLIRDFLEKGIELERPCRVAYLLVKSGINPNQVTFRSLAEECIKQQREDGGWLDVTSTMWCTAFLSLLQPSSPAVDKAILWLQEQRHQDGSWGASYRDIGRIPVVGPILFLLPQLVSERSLEWLEDEWTLEWNLSPRLTYKGAFTLMAFGKSESSPSDDQLIPRTVEWLVQEQNDDFGWGPWRNHPIGSTPRSTGITLTGLLEYSSSAEPTVFQNGVEWLVRKQLEGGLWPDHYIDDGSAWAFFALSRTLSHLHSEPYDPEDDRQVG